MRLLTWMTGRMAGRWAAPVVIAVALVLALPSLWAPFFIDEHVQAGKWKESQAPGFVGSVPNQYFVFSSPASNRQDMESTHGAWWTAPDFKVAFWRPLTALTHAVDHLLWPGNAVLMHVQGLLWFVLLLLGLNQLLRRFLAPPVATLALALYAWDDARGMVLSWIANRHALVAAVLGICVLLVYDRWRRDGWRLGAWLAPLLLALGLLSSELALASTGFLLGHALWVDQGPLARRLVRLLPCAVVVLAWQVCYTAGGWGVTATGGYLDPLHEPLSYFAHLLERALVLLLGQLTPIMADLWGMLPAGGRGIVLLLAIVTAIATARVAWPRISGDRHARFWLLGGGLALALACTSGPQDRNLSYVGLGVAPVLAAVFVRAVAQPPAARWPRFAVGMLAAFNLIVAPLLLPVKCLTILGLQRALAATDESIPRSPDVRDRTLVVAWTALEPGVYYSAVRRDDEGSPRPARIRILAASSGDVSVTRPDEVTLRLRPADGFFAGEAARIFRSASRPFHNGEVVALSNMTATVTEITSDGRPQTVEFRFAAPLESSEWLWMRGAKLGLVPWTPPPVGGTALISTAR